MKAAIAGYSQSGKKTLFTLLTGRKLHAAAKPGEAVEGRAAVRDPRVDRIAGIVRPAKTTYAETVLQLCPDAGEGASRDWVDPARRCDLVCFLVRAFSDGSVYHPKGSVDPVRDRRELQAELLLADLEMVETRLDRMSKEKRAGLTSSQKAEEHVLTRCKSALEDEKPASALNLDSHEVASVRSLGLLTLKPVLWILNVDEDDLAEKGDEIRISCRIEEEIAEMDGAEERREYLSALGLKEPGIDRFNARAYDALGYMSFYTMGEDEVRAWTIRKGALAPEAAGRIHSDIERGFIRAEVIKYDDLIALGSEKAVREHGKVMLKGKDYAIQDGDICSFLFNV